MRHDQQPTIEIGSVSWGTMRTEDLLPTFLGELQRLDPDVVTRIVTEYGVYLDHNLLSDWIRDNPDDADIMLHESVWEALNELAPPYMYFGSSECDGADYGWWSAIDVHDATDVADYNPDDDTELLSVTDMSDVPSGYTGHVLHINDHGNMALYKPRIEWDEVWSIV